MRVVTQDIIVRPKNGFGCNIELLGNAKHRIAFLYGIFNRRGAQAGVDTRMRIRLTDECFLCWAHLENRNVLERCFYWWCAAVNWSGSRCLSLIIHRTGNLRLPKQYRNQSSTNDYCEHPCNSALALWIFFACGFFQVFVCHFWDYSLF